ncbi:MAG: acyl-CoA dehydrogenase family protein [Solirubrobacteraceae bacterium]
MNAAERSMGIGLRALRAAASSPLLDRLRMRERAEQIVYRATKTGFRSAASVSRTFKATQKLTGPSRQQRSGGGDQFDLTPSDEQQMLIEAISAFAAEQVRVKAHAAEEANATPQELLTQAQELGLSMLGIPEELGGVMAERSAVTAVLVSEALAHGDMGIAYATLAPGAVASALGLWGDAEQQATYLPAFTGENVPAAALALLEPRPLFDPLALQSSARRDGSDWILDGVKSLVPALAKDELFIIAANVAESGPALFIAESSTTGLTTEAEPAMGLRAAATGRLRCESVRLPGRALLGQASPDVYTECIHRSRIAWCALALGTAQAVLDYVIPYIKERTAFGESIANRQAVAFTVSDIAIELEGMRLATYRAASLADRGKSFAHEAALARHLCAEKGMKIGSDGVQLLGGHGFVKEHPVERFYRDLRAAGVMEGALLV